MSKLTIMPATDRSLGSIRPRLPFNARPVSAGGRADRSATGPFATHYTAVASFLYINRQPGEDRFGKLPDHYMDRGDLVATGICHPQKMPAELKDGYRLWREADAATADEGPQAIAATHIVADLPPGDTPERWRRLVERYCYRALVELGMIASWAIHARSAPDGGWATPPHVHILCTARCWRPTPRKGDRQRQWLANAQQIRAAEELWLEMIGLRPAAAATVIAV